MTGQCHRIREEYKAIALLEQKLLQRDRFTTEEIGYKSLYNLD
jgi:hypothetical protein